MERNRRANRNRLRMIGTLMWLLLAGAVVPGTAAGAEIRPLLRALAIDVPIGGLTAPPFALPDAQGRRMPLEASRGRVVMLYFWTTY